MYLFLLIKTINQAELVYYCDRFYPKSPNMTRLTFGWCGFANINFSPIFQATEGRHGSSSFRLQWALISQAAGSLNIQYEWTEVRFSRRSCDIPPLLVLTAFGPQLFCLVFFFMRLSRQTRWIIRVWICRPSVAISLQYSTPSLASGLSLLSLLHIFSRKPLPLSSLHYE